MHARRRTMFVPVLALLMLGMAYAQFTSSVTANVTAKAGTLDFKITAVTLALGSPSYIGISCDPSCTPSASTVTISVGPFAPGASATVNIVITNLGSLPGTVKVGAVTIIHSDGQWWSLTLTQPLTPFTLNPGDSVTYQVTFTLKAGTDNEAKGDTASATLTVTGSVGA
jgi:uncharacterized membrane protein